MTNKNSLFTQKHYEHMMDVVSRVPLGKRTYVAELLCDVFEKDNPKFSRSRFQSGITHLSLTRLVEQEKTNV